MGWVGRVDGQKLRGICDPMTTKDERVGLDRDLGEVVSVEMTRREVLLGLVC